MMRRPNLTLSAVAVLTALSVGCDTSDAPVPVDGDIAVDTTADDDSGVLVDPLSMPESPHFSPADFTSAKGCGSCHEEYLAQWATSSHAYAMVDPVFQALVKVRQVDRDTREDPFCTQCHSSIGTRGGECVPGFQFEDLSPIVMEGITCDSCHRVSDIQRLHNAGHVVDPAAPVAAGLADPMPTTAHNSRFDERFQKAEFCATCHDVQEVNGLPLERPYAEWTTSPAAGSRQCQDCHMPTYSGTAAPGAAPRSNLHSHRFVGVALPLLDDFITDENTLAELDTAIDALLGSAASIRVSGSLSTVSSGRTADIVVTVKNEIDGHNLPTGSTFLRQMWVHLTVVDATGRTLYETGSLDDNGDLKDIWSELEPYGDPDLLTYHSQLIDAKGNPTIFTWVAEEHRARALPPLHERTHTLFAAIDDDAVGPLTITARVSFRSIGPYVLRALGLTDLIDKLVVRELAVDTAELPLPTDEL